MVDETVPAPPAPGWGGASQGAPLSPTPGWGGASGGTDAHGLGWGGKKPVHQITNDNEYDLLRPGDDFIDPNGQTRTKPWTVKRDRDYEEVPEGSDFIDPAGQLRTKPKFEGVDFTTQTLFNMALNDKERRKALERNYPGKVRDDIGELYVAEDDGRMLKPGSGSLATRVPAFIASAAAPAVGSVAGAIGANAPGAVGGGILGQFFNDLILDLAGVSDRETTERFANLGMAGATSFMGHGVGRGIAHVAPIIKEGVASGSAAVPGVVRSLLGAHPEKTAKAADLAEKGVKVPPSAWAEESPYLHRTVEVFDPTFRTQNVLEQSAKGHYESEAGRILDDLGVPKASRPESIISPSAAVSAEKAGAALLEKAGAEVAAQDAHLANMMKLVRERSLGAAGEGAEATQARIAALEEAATTSRKAADDAIQAVFKVIDDEVEQAFKAAKVGENSGDLWESIAEKFRASAAAIKARSSKMYKDARDMGADHVPDSQGLGPLAQNFVESLPEPFRAKHPDLVKRIARLAPVEDAEGKVARDAIQPSFAELHDIRSMLRADLDYNDLTPSIRDGAYKFFAKRVDEVLHNPGAVSELKEAARLLDEADRFYAANMAIYKDRQIKAVMRGLEGGEPADPRVLADVLLKSGRSDLINRAKELIGPNLWSAVKAADVQDLLAASKGLEPGKIDGVAFIRQVLDRDRSGLLETVHGKEMAGRLRTQAQQIQALSGRLDVDVLPNDTVSSLVQKARAAAVAEKEAAALNPLGTLERETKRIEKEGQRAQSHLARDRSREPLGHLYKPTMGAVQAAEEILAKEDLMFAAAAKFGQQSPEFEMLRQIAAQRILQGTMEPGKRLAKIPDELQQLIFGASAKDVQALAKDMEFLMGTKALDQSGAGSSIAAQQRVLNPWGAISGLGPLAKPLKVIPGVDTIGRKILTDYYKLLSTASTNPAFLRWVAKGLESGPEAREMVRETVQRTLGIGAGAGQMMYQGSGGEKPQPRRRAQ